MASLAIHLSAFLFFFPVGVRRLLCSFSLYLKNPPLYQSKAWYFSDPLWKNFDFYSLLIALPIASFSLVFFFILVSGHPNYRFSLLQQSLVVFFFWLLLILIIFRENFDLFAIPDHYVFAFAGISFLVEYLLNGKGITGLGGVAYELLGGLTLVCASCCLFLSIRRSAFFAEFLLSFGLVLKGTWVLQIGLSLYTDTFVVKGCDKILTSPAEDKTDVKCELEEDRLRGMALINLLFIGHAIFVLIASFVFFGLLCYNRSLRCVETSGSLLADPGSEHMLTHSLPEFETE